VANDIDVYVGPTGDGELRLRTDTDFSTHKKIDGIEREVNVINCRTLSSDNDINATSACIEVTSSDSVWEFLLQTNCALKATRTGVGARTLVRLAYKSFKMGIPFEATDPAGQQIMAESEPVFNSHSEKVKEMEGWDLSPFTFMKLEKAASGFVFKSTVTKIDCSGGCATGRANRQCKAKLCKRCCLLNDQTEKCSTHGKKKTPSSSSN
jgi:hypothetical protein